MGFAIALTAGTTFATTSSPSGGGTVSYNNGAAGTFYFDDPKYVLVTPVAGDTVVITGITKNNTGGGGLNEALNGGSDGNATGSWTMELHGNTLTGAPASGIDALIKTTNGTLTIDTTGAAANIFNRGGLVGETATSGNLIMNIGADTFNTPGALNGITANSAGTLTLNSLATITVAGAGRGISATSTGVGAAGLVTLGTLNGGIKGTITATAGTGIWVSGPGIVGTINNLTIGSTGVINAATGIQVAGGHFTVDNFGSITGTTAALAESNNSNTTSPAPFELVLPEVWF